MFSKSEFMEFFGKVGGNIFFGIISFFWSIWIFLWGKEEVNRYIIKGESDFLMKRRGSL